jgi:hypothetical protein
VQKNFFFVDKSKSINIKIDNSRLHFVYLADMLNKAVEKELVLKDSVKLVSINERSIYGILSMWMLFLELSEAVF